MVVPANYGHNGRVS